MDEAMIALQETVAHQAVEIEQLNGELYAQQKELAELKRQVKMLHDKLGEGAGSAGHAHSDSPEPPPPHY